MTRIIILTCLVQVLSVVCQGAFAEASPPNFVIIFCDNLGYGDIEPFGSTLHRTPHLNRMANEGRKFTHFCVTAGVCTPSRASLMTGCYSQRIGMHVNPRDGHVLRPVSPYGLHPDEITIAEVLHEQGYATGIFGKWHLGDQKRFLPTRQGFDRFFGIPYSDDMTRAVGLRLNPRFNGSAWPELPLMEGENVIEAPVDRDALTKRTTQEVLTFIQQNKDHPFFVYFPQCMPGSTATPFASKEFRGKSQNGAWGDAIEEIDWSTGQILDHLIELGIEERTLVIWLSDNGAPLARDMQSLARGSNRPLHGRGYTTSEGAFRSPTIMWQPKHVAAGTTCSEFASTMDFMPTLAALAGADISRNVDGFDIRSLIFSNGKSPYQAFFYYYMDQLQAVRSGHWKLFLPLESFVRHPHFRNGESDRPLLFNVTTDISCERNVAQNHPNIVKRLMEFASEAKADLGDSGQTGTGQRSPGHLTDTEPVPLVITQ